MLLREPLGLIGAAALVVLLAQLLAVLAINKNRSLAWALPSLTLLLQPGLTGETFGLEGLWIVLVPVLGLVIVGAAQAILLLMPALCPKCHESLSNADRKNRTCSRCSATTKPRPDQEQTPAAISAHQACGFLSKYVVPPLTVLSENTYMSAIRAGMVSIVPLTIIGGFFTIVTQMPIERWQALVAPYRQFLEIPWTATFGVLSVFVCFFIAYDLAKQFKQEAIVSAGMATLVFLMIQIKLEDQTLSMKYLDSNGLFTAILIALITVRVQRFFTDRNFVIRLPENVPPVVYESFLSLSPLFLLVLDFWLIRFVLGVDINSIVQNALTPVVLAVDTLPGILVYAFLVTLLWSVGINGDNAMDAIVAPIFLGFLAQNGAAALHHQPLPYVTALGFFTTFVNVGGTGATIALALVLWNSKEPGFRKVSRVAMPTQIFQINEPMFFGIPIVLNPIFMIPYILNALILTTGTYALMYWNVIQRPFVAIPWTTPPIIGHYLVSGGDWRAAIWGCISLVIAMVVYYPFAKIAERQRLQAEAAGKALE